jgi:hypothetical protein
MAIIAAVSSLFSLLHLLLSGVLLLPSLFFSEGDDGGMFSGELLMTIRPTLRTAYELFTLLYL